MELRERLENLAHEVGFECIGFAPASELHPREEVRNMCASGRCKIYGTRWACPPACPSIEEYQQKFTEFDSCMVVQTVFDLEDEFDGETMMEASETHGKRGRQFADALAGFEEPTLFLSAGTCTLCEKCTYPDEPCRFPDKQLVSMEASGLVVSEACEAANIPYNHGKLKIAYVSCVLF